MLLAGATSALAVPQVKMSNDVGGDSNPFKGGGLFIGDFNNQSSLDYLGNFNTFCLERSESLKFGSWYEYSVSDAAVSGGANSANTPGYDNVSAGTAWIFKNLAQGTLTAAKANAVQWVIWLLEDEITPSGAQVATMNANTGGLYSAYLNQTLSQFGNSLANAKADKTDASVKVLNLVDTDNSDKIFADLSKTVPVYKRQDVLICIPVADGGMTLLLLGAGLTAVGVARRRLV